MINFHNITWENYLEVKWLSFTFSCFLGNRSPIPPPFLIQNYPRIKCLDLGCQPLYENQMSRPGNLLPSSFMFGTSTWTFHVCLTPKCLVAPRALANVDVAPCWTLLILFSRFFIFNYNRVVHSFFHSSNHSFIHSFTPGSQRHSLAPKSVTANATKRCDIHTVTHHNHHHHPHHHDILNAQDHPKLAAENAKRFQNKEKVMSSFSLSSSRGGCFSPPWWCWWWRQWYGWGWILVNAYFNC